MKIKDLKPTDIVFECTQCGSLLKEDKIVWLELNNQDGYYYFVNYTKPIPEEHSQGAFAFGKDCASKVGRIYKGEEHV